jgi:hypothetical protein
MKPDNLLALVVRADFDYEGVIDMERSKPLEFLEKANKDPKLSARIFSAVERGAKVTAEEVLQLAHEFGYSFTQGEFVEAVRRSITDRFAAGDEGSAELSAKKKGDPPESSCAWGCLSYTKTWHPSDFKLRE